MSSVHTPATFHERLRISSCCFENGLGHHGPDTAGTGEPGDRRRQMEKQDGQLALDPSSQAGETQEMLRK
jgi:hypothetical protein